jgi:hypothetical protein
LTSKNPDSDIAAMVAIDGGYDPCNSSSVFGSRSTTNSTTVPTTTASCDAGFVLDSANGYCYIVLQGFYFREDAADIW